MLYYVSGPVTVLEPGLAVIDCNGVGYGCRVSAYTAAQLKLNQPARLYITESIREDAFDLYGFISREEQNCYELLVSVNGVGPKAAIAILSGGPQNFTLAVMTGDEKLLTAAQGVGKKLAQRIILELKDKIGGGTESIDLSAGISAPAVSGSNTALATAGDLPLMASAFRQAIEAGRKAYLSGLGRVLSRGASASDPLTGFLRD